MYKETAGNFVPMCFRYLQERLKQMEEEKSVAMAAVTKYKVRLGSGLFFSYFLLSIIVPYIYSN